MMGDLYLFLQSKRENHAAEVYLFWLSAGCGGCNVSEDRGSNSRNVAGIEKSNRYINICTGT